MEDRESDGTLLAKTRTYYCADGQVQQTLNAECFNYPSGAQSTGNTGCEMVTYAYQYPSSTKEPQVFAGALAS